MTMTKMFCLFMCLGCAVAQSSSDEEEQAQCDQCDNEGPAGEFTECDGCGDIVCDDCRECGEDCFVCRDAESGAASTTRLTSEYVLSVTLENENQLETITVTVDAEEYDEYNADEDAGDAMSDWIEEQCYATTTLD